MIEYQSWPLVNVDPETTSPRVKDSIIKGSWKESGGVSSWTPEEFGGVTFQKNFEFNYYVDPSELLANKSLIGERSQWPYEYDTQAYRTLYGHWPRKPPQRTKRLIIDYLTRNDLDLRRIIDVISTGEIPQEWKIMVAVAKEREFKREKARFYGKLTQEMRMYQVATEANIADQIFPYIKQQSMKMAKEEYLRTIIKLTPQVVVQQQQPRPAAGFMIRQLQPGN